MHFITIPNLFLIKVSLTHSLTIAEKVQIDIEVESTGTLQVKVNLPKTFH
jgi:hypothetical protein